MPVPTRRPLPLVSLRVVSLAIALVAVGCGSDGTDEPQTITNDPFCERALEYERFEPALGQVADDPAQTEVFVSAWLDRLDVLIDRSPDELDDELITIRSSVEALERELQEVDYNLLDLSFEQLEILNDDPESDVAIADQTFRAFVDERCSGPAPSPLDDAELAELLGDTGTPVDAEIDAAVSADLAEDLGNLLGIQPEAAECVADNLEPETLDDILAGILDDDTTDGLLAVLDTCGISTEDLLAE